jgi:hypothetical protein
VAAVASAEVEVALEVDDEVEMADAMSVRCVSTVRGSVVVVAVMVEVSSSSRSVMIQMPLLMLLSGTRWEFASESHNLGRAEPLTNKRHTNRSEITRRRPAPDRQKQECRAVPSSVARGSRHAVKPGNTRNYRKPAEAIDRFVQSVRNTPGDSSENVFLTRF